MDMTPRSTSWFRRGTAPGTREPSRCGVCLWSAARSGMPGSATGPASARAETEVAKVLRQVGSRWYPTPERAAAKVEAILARRHLRDLYDVTCDPSAAPAGRPAVTCTLSPEALARAEALDGYYVLETTRTVAAADATAVLAEWKGQWQVEHRHRDAKGPLRIRPLFVTSNRRIVGLVTILGIALLVFSLIEREVRRALQPGEKVAGFLAGHVVARPTGENVLKALREIA